MTIYRWEPQPGITTYELAQLMPFLTTSLSPMQNDLEALWEKLGPLQKYLPREEKATAF